MPTQCSPILGYPTVVWYCQCQQCIVFLSLHPTSELQYSLGAMSDRTSADALLPGTGYSPDYGINDSVDGDSMTSSSEKSSTPAVSQSTQDGPKKKNRIWVVAMCALIACLASLVNGLMLSFSSPTLDILSLSPSSAHYIQNGSTAASLFGVCFLCSTNISVHNDYKE